MDTKNDVAKILSESLNISDIFNEFYSVPDFQREFVWTEKEVSNMLNDIYEAFFDENGKLLVDHEYFIGSIVTSKNSNNDFDIIDGQQRLTTFFIFFSAVRDLFIELGKDPPPTLSKLICEDREDEKGIGFKSTFRIKLQYDSGREIIDKIGSIIKKSDNVVSKCNYFDTYESNSKSVNNLLEAYSTIMAFLKENMKNEIDKIGPFWKAVKDNVKLIRINTPDISDALYVFETINHRGKSLEPIDLLKNLIFRKAIPEDFQKIKDIWIQIIKNLEIVKEKPMRFLRYFLISYFIDDVKVSEPPREENIYKWIKDWIKVNNQNNIIENNPVQFAKDMLKQTEVWLNYCNYKDPKGKPNDYIRNISIMSKDRIKQHFMLLLSGQHLTDEQFNRLTQHIENLLFCYLITNEQPKTWERTFIRMSKELKNVTNDDELSNFINNNIQKQLMEKLPILEFTLNNLKEDRLYRYQLKYYLTKIEKYLTEKVTGHQISLDSYNNSTIHIEHILPQTPSASGWQFDKPYDEYVNRLGNLTLLEQKTNESASNSKDKKKKIYASSKFILTSILTKPVHTGEDKTKHKLIKHFEGLEIGNWNSKMIDNRQKGLTEIAKKVWGFDFIN